MSDTRKAPWKVSEIAATLAVSEKKVDAWIKAGHLKAIDVSQSRSKRPRWRVLPADFEAFIAARRSAPTSAETAAVTRTKRKPSSSLIEVY